MHLKGVIPEKKIMMCDIVLRFAGRGKIMFHTHKKVFGWQKKQNNNIDDSSLDNCVLTVVYSMILDNNSNLSWSYIVHRILGLTWHNSRESYRNSSLKKLLGPWILHLSHEIDVQKCFTFSLAVLDFLLIWLAFCFCWEECIKITIRIIVLLQYYLQNSRKI